MAILTSRDNVYGTLRAHHQILAKALNFIGPGVLELKAEFPADNYKFLRQILAEIMGLEQGFGSGRGGSMHLYHHDAGSAFGYPSKDPEASWLTRDPQTLTTGTETDQRK